MDLKKHLAWHERRIGKQQSIRQRVLAQLRAKGIKAPPSKVEQMVRACIDTINENHAAAQIAEARTVTIDGPAHVPGLE